MTEYVKSTNFASKDSLSVGNPLKIVKGTEIDTEFTNIAVAVATKADLANPTLTGVPSAPTASAGTSTTQIATTAFVTDAVATGKVNTALTGVPTAPTAAVNTNTTQVATTAFTVAQIADDAPTKTGTGASGTWDINITGSAASATTASTASTVSDDAITKDKLQSPSAGSTYLIARLVINSRGTESGYFGTDHLYAQNNSVGVTALVPGVIRCSFDHRNFSGSGTANSRILKNGVQQATWATSSSSFTTRTLDLTVDVGDLIIFQQAGSPEILVSEWRNVFVYSNNPSMAVA